MKQFSRDEKKLIEYAKKKFLEYSRLRKKTVFMT